MIIYLNFDCANCSQMPKRKPEKLNIILTQETRNKLKTLFDYFNTSKSTSTLVLMLTHLYTLCVNPTSVILNPSKSVLSYIDWVGDIITLMHAYISQKQVIS